MKLGLALSGGGIKGIAHAGVLKALNENNINIDIIGGTSSGSIISGLYSIGYSPYYIYVLFKRYANELVNENSKALINNFGTMFFGKKTPFRSFYNGEIMEKKLNDIAEKKGIKNISDIKFPLVIPAVDIKDGKEYIFTNESKEDGQISDINFGKALRASSSFPIVFDVCKYENHHFSDGGILDNIPVKEVKKQGADKVIAVAFKEDRVNEESSIMEIGMKSVDIMQKKLLEENIKYSDFVLNIETPKMGLLDIEQIDECYNSGYKETIKNIDKIREIINKG